MCCLAPQPSSAGLNDLRELIDEERLMNLEKAVSRQITGKLPPVEMEGQRLRARI